MAEEKTKEEQDLQNRLYQSIGFEVAANTAVDAATSWLMPAAPVYAGVNFVASGAINTLAQLWRQDDNFSWGEVGASSAIGIVPGLGGKGVTGIAKATVKGAGLGVAHESIRVGVDEQRLLTPEEVAGGALLGGAFGGGTKVIGDSVGVLAKHQTDKIANRRTKGSYTRPGTYTDRTDIWKPDDLTGPQKTYERFAKRTYYPTEPLRDLWETQIQSKSKFPTDLDRMREGLPPLRQRLMDDIDGNPNLTTWQKVHVMEPELQLFHPKRRNLNKKGKMKSPLYRALDEQSLLGQAERVLSKIDEFRTTQNFGGKFNPERPTTGFRGTRTIKYKLADGTESEIGWRWSKSARGGLGDYKPYDVPTQLATVARRAKWNINRSSRSKPWADKIFKDAKEQNAVVKEALKNLRKENPEYFWKVMGENYDATKGHVYVEHLHPQKSPVWIEQADGSVRHRITGHAPRDSSNLLIVPGPEMGALKTAIENILYNKPKNTLWLDFNRKRRVLVLKNQEGEWVGDISTITNVENAERALDAARRGHKIKPGKEGEIQEVIQADPKTPKRIEALDMEDDPRWKDIKD